jgi:hypothetical protein
VRLDYRDDQKFWRPDVLGLELINS